MDTKIAGRIGGLTTFKNKGGRKYFQELAKKSHLKRSIEKQRKKIKYENSKI
jgi:hypothetical protein